MKSKSALVLLATILVVFSGCFFSSISAAESIFGVGELESVRLSLAIAEGSSGQAMVGVVLAGKVQYPGFYEVNEASGVIGALLTAGGVCEDGSLRSVEHWRDDRLIAVYDLYDFIKSGADTSFSPLENYDRLLVPEVGALVSIQGGVSRPGLYELISGSISPAHAVALAGGLLNPDQPAMVNFFFTAGSGDLAKEISLAHVVEDPVRIRGQVSITVVSVSGQQPHDVLLEGVVSKAVPWNSALSIRKVLEAYAELFEQEAYGAYAEILRSGGLDEEYQVLSFSPEAVLQDGEGEELMLRPGDRIVVFPADLFYKSAKVTSEGKVKDPGAYSFKRDMRVADLLDLSGGISGTCTRLYLVRRQIKNTKLSSIEIELSSDYLAGNSRFNVILMPFDTLVVE